MITHFRLLVCWAVTPQMNLGPIFDAVAPAQFCVHFVANQDCTECDLHVDAYVCTQVAFAVICAHVAQPAASFGGASDLLSSRIQHFGPMHIGHSCQVGHHKEQNARKFLG
uniref:Secreted protein n=1 Tax=Eutreptiella gymnastica TaxID=73025 RepID=A0A7S4LIY2_9EUGL